MVVIRQNALCLPLNTQIPTYRVYNITDQDGDGFYGVVTLMLGVVVCGLKGIHFADRCILTTPE
jgi:hypothetical protein